MIATFEFSEGSLSTLAFLGAMSLGYVFGRVGHKWFPPSDF